MTGSQCSWMRLGVTWSNRPRPKTSRAGVFCTGWSGSSVDLRIVLSTGCCNSLVWTWWSPWLAAVWLPGRPPGLWLSPASWLPRDPDQLRAECSLIKNGSALSLIPMTMFMLPSRGKIIAAVRLKNAYQYQLSANPRTKPMSEWVCRV